MAILLMAASDAFHAEAAAHIAATPANEDFETTGSFCRYRGF
jgi:hypothetical protein